MKGIIVYFSQAGSTQKIAQAIHKGMNQRVEQCDIARLKEIKTEDLANYDLIGLGSPVWRCRASLNMENFIDNMNVNSLKGKHCFYFCTHGAAPGTAVAITVTAMKRNRLTVIGWADWYGSVFLPYMPKPYFTDGHPDAIDLQEAKEFGIEMAGRSLRISRGETALIPVLPEGKEYLEIYGESPVYSRDWADLLSFEFKINEEKCTRCMVCVDNCPSGNIEFSESFPAFKMETCRKCWYCEQICPEGAIEFDWGNVARVIMKDFKDDFAGKLELAEAKGRFRRLVPLDDVGWDTPWYKVSTHPRLVVP
ncbi:EFR1 family ferrodoxin [Chloroflexota bacterium]